MIKEAGVGPLNKKKTFVGAKCGCCLINCRSNDQLFDSSNTNIRRHTLFGISNLW